MKNKSSEDAVGIEKAVTAAPPGSPNSFLGFPLALDLDHLDADIAILGVPFGLRGVGSARTEDVEADGLDPTIMPAVNAPTPGGLTWIQIHKLGKEGPCSGHGSHRDFTGP